MTDDLFILGSGFSKAISNGTMPTLSELSQNIISKLDTIFLPHEMPPHKLSANIETLLSYLAIEQPWIRKSQSLRNRAAFLELSKIIGEELDEKQNRALISGLNEWFSCLVSKWHESRTIIISFNYDLLVECEATKIKAPDNMGGKGGSNLSQDDIYPVSITPALQRTAGVLGGLSHDSFCLLKLHGSLNWYYSGAEDYRGESLYTYPVQDGRCHQKEAYRIAILDKVPLIVPPTLDKNSYFNNETISIIWQAAGQAFKMAKRIFCLGYSFPETDMMIRHFMLTNENPEGAKFYWVSLSDHTGKLEELLPENYTIDRTYLGTDSIKNFAEAYTQGKVS